MSVQVGSLSYVSTLDNSDFQAKSLQDLQLIRLRLELEGNTSGVAAYDKAVKDALNSEIKNRQALNEILTEAKINIDELTDGAKRSGTIFSDSVAEVKAYTDSLQVLGDTGNVALSGVDALLTAFNADLASGKITAAEYAEAITAMSEAQQRFTQSTQQTSVQIEAEIGEVERLKIVLADLKAAQFSASEAALPEINQNIQTTELALAQSLNVGKAGFDALGNEIEKTTTKSNRFQQAIDRVTNIGNLGARVVSQFTRQIISLGVGFLSLEIGAKAISSLIEYVQNLDYFTGRLDQATQNLAAFNSVQKEASDIYGKSAVSLQILYQAATDTTASMNDRIAAAEKLKDENFAELGTSSALAIVNGDLKKTYDELTQSLLQQAIVQASLNELGKVGATIANAQIQQGKIRAAQQNELKRIVAPGAGSNAQSFGGPTGGGAVGSTRSVAEQQKAINDRANAALDEQDKIIQVAKGQAQIITSVAGGASKIAATLEGTNKLITDPLDKFDAIIATFNDKGDLVKLQQSLQAKLDSLTPSDPQFATLKQKLQKVDDLIKQYQVKATGRTVIDPSITEGQSLLAQQTSLLQNIDALKQKYTAKDTERENQNLYDIDANFQKQYDAIVAFNVKRQNFIDNFNERHKKDKKAGQGEAYANSIGLTQQNPNQLSADEFKALSTQADINENAFIAQDIAKKKKLYDDYEAYRLKVGDTVANNDYEDLLKSGKDFQTYLQNIQGSIDNTDTSGPIQARKELIQKQLDENIEAQKVALQKLKEDYASYEQEREALIGAAQTKELALNKAGDAQAAQQVQSDLSDQLDQLAEANEKKLSAYKQLFANINTLTITEAKQAIGNLITYYSFQFGLGKISAQAFYDLITPLTQKLRDLNDIKFDNIASVGQSLITISSALQSINPTFASYINSLGQIGVGIQKVNAEFDQLSKDQEAGKNTFGDYANIVATGLTGILDIIGTISTAEEQRKKASTDYYNSVIEFQTQYNVALDEQVRLQYQTDGTLFGTNTAKQLSDAAQAYKDASQQYTQSLQALQAGQAIVGSKSVVNGSNVGKSAVSGASTGGVIGALLGGPIGALAGGVIGGAVGAIAGIFGGKTPADVLRPLLQVYPQLIQANGDFNESLAKTLVANNQVSDSTKTLLNNTIAYYNEQQTALTQITTALQALVGNLGTSISDSLVSAFENGTDAAKAFGQSVSDVLSNIVQQDLFQAIFGSQLNDLQTKLTAIGKASGNDPNTNAEIIAAIEAFYKNAGSSVTEFTNGLKAAQQAASTQGLTLFPPTSSTGTQSTLSGGIQASITEATADILAGTLEGIQLGVYDGNKTLGQMLILAQDHLNIAIQIEANTKRSADNSDSLPAMLSQLSAIAVNTGGSLGIDLRAAGYFHY